MLGTRTDKLVALTGLLLTALALLRGIVPARFGPGPGVLWWAAGLGLWGIVAAWRRRREPATASPTRDPGALLLVSLLGLFLALVFSHPNRLVSDGVDQFVYLRSVVVDGDLDLANDFAIFYPDQPREDLRTPIGRTGNPHAVGPALLWAPFYLVAEALARLIQGGSNGATGFHRNAVAIASVLYGWLGLVLLYRTLLRLTRRSIALGAALGIGCGTFLYWYLTFEPTMSHGMSFAAVTLVVALWLEPRPRSARRFALLGAACGLAALMRWANVLTAILPRGEWLAWAVRERRWRDLARSAAAFVAAALVVFSPQMIVWQRLYGSPLTIPQGPGFVGQAPAWSAVLFSPDHGLFAWSPILYLGALGLLLFARRRPWQGAVALAFLVVFLRVNAGVADWWGGAAFGARRFDAALPFFGIGLALALELVARVSGRQPLAVVGLMVAAFVFWNTALAHETAIGAWSLSEPVSFERMGQAVTSRISSGIGSPFSLPGAFWDWAAQGTPPRHYEAQFSGHERGRWVRRDLGWDDTLDLTGGWSDQELIAGERCRLVRGRAARIGTLLAGRGARRLGARLIAPSAGRDVAVHVYVNGRRVGDLTATPAWRDAVLEIEGEAWKRMRNNILLENESEAELAFAALWIEPGESPPAESAPSGGRHDE